MLVLYIPESEPILSGASVQQHSILLQEDDKSNRQKVKKFRTQNGTQKFKLANEQAILSVFFEGKKEGVS